MLLHDWPVPDNVAIAMTDRHGGVSLAPYDSLNLGLHVGDAPQQVLANRGILAKQLGLVTEPVWLEQVHGTHVVDLADIAPINLAQEVQDTPPLVADASYTDLAGRVCVVMTADCLPVLLCNQQGTEVAAAHAGWRGLCDGVIEASVAKFASKPSELIAYLGPAIGPKTFEVGAEVRAAFMATVPNAENCFVAQCQATKPDKYLADIIGLAKLRLKQLGIKQVYSADICTVSNPDYFSYRRDKITGRMASLIWLKS
ncbi:peptidoglycan editing factor PgeF [Shewanella mangrovisoli]|uniref:peptidoglycan editing factor PgeF n=1 Tax=Shewanella mangrovisoli TaxID=2864211 RepID=UPI001C661709|nr:peptidoglycan editing factor PgeF [Shewanella mangrovisoli]QYK08280.1 peptidoglycan editing factor PgeF [Shewanella mangrovisoli]